MAALYEARPSVTIRSGATPWFLSNLSAAALFRRRTANVLRDGGAELVGPAETSPRQIWCLLLAELGIDVSYEWSYLVRLSSGEEVPTTKPDIQQYVTRAARLRLAGFSGGRLGRAGGAT
jgi:hypothetical protein